MAVQKKPQLLLDTLDYKLLLEIKSCVFVLKLILS